MKLIITAKLKGGWTRSRAGDAGRTWSIGRGSSYNLRVEERAPELATRGKLGDVREAHTTILSLVVVVINVLYPEATLVNKVIVCTKSNLAAAIVQLSVCLSGCVCLY